MDRDEPRAYGVLEAPQNVTVDAIDSTSVHVQWSSPASGERHGIHEVRGYHVHYAKVNSRDVEISQNQCSDTLDSESTDALITGLDPDTRYSFQVSAFTQIIKGIKSPRIFISTKLEVPGVPKYVQADAINSTNIHVQWLPPAPSERHGDIRGYQVHYAKVNSRDEEILRYPYYDTRDGDSVNALITGLDPNTRYRFQVLAYTRSGGGIKSPATFTSTERAEGAESNPRASITSSVDLEPYLKEAPVCSLDTDEEDSADEVGSPKKKPYIKSLSSEEVELQMNKNLIDDERQSNASTLPIDKRSDPHTSASDDDSHSEAEVEAAAYNVMDIPTKWEPRYTPEPPSYDQAVRTEQMDIEEQSPKPEAPDCSMFGPFSGFCAAIARCFSERINTPMRFLFLVLVIIGIVGLALLIVLIPTSFVSLEYNLIALETNTMTGSVDRSRVYYPGCYLLTPNSEFIEYPGTVHSIVESITIITTDELSIDITFHLHYFIKPEELGQLHEKFELDYKDPLRLIIISSIKNVATQYTLDEFRAKRMELQEVLLQHLRKKLAGNCCPACCPGHCKNITVCATCESPKSCNPAYNIEIRYFYLAEVDPPQEVLERYMRGLVLQIQEEREQFIQDKALEDKQSERERKQFLNSADEILANATAQSTLIGVTAAAEKDKIVHLSYIDTLKIFFDNLNIREEDHKLSLIMIRNLEDSKNLVNPGYSFEKQTLTRP